MIILVRFELNNFSTRNLIDEIVVDDNKGMDKLSINLEVDIHKMPCSILSLDIQDIMGSHTVNVDGTLIKERLSVEGKSLGIYSVKGSKFEDGRESHETEADINEIKQDFLNKQGCKLKGKFDVNKVPGNFHISSHAYNHLATQLIYQQVYTWDYSHTVHHLSFGDRELIEKLSEKVDTKNMHPIDGKEKINDMYKKQTEYFMNIIGSNYNLDFEAIDVYQITLTESVFSVDNHVPGVYFRYDLSPINVNYSYEEKNIFELFITICGIIGGTYGVFGVIDSIFFNLMPSLLTSAAK